MSPTQVQFWGSALFGLAIIHTFMTAKFRHWAHRYPENSFKNDLLHLLGEVEVVFGVWGSLFMGAFVVFESKAEAIAYLESRNFTEPLFVFVIMSLCATRPILEAVEILIIGVSRLIPLPSGMRFFLACLIVGPLLGSFITEPAAMTVTALLLLQKFYGQSISPKLKYATLGLLFVNISIGGTLTPYAAPPVLMVASVWNWDMNFMLTHFGWKAVVSILLSTIFVLFCFRSELKRLKIESKLERKIPLWVILVHLGFLAIVVSTAHHPTVFMGAFLLLLGFVSVTRSHQAPLKLRESLLVGYFLAGLVVLGGLQNWWLEPLIASLSDSQLYIGATALTAITDNAALTYLGAQVPSLSDSAKYFLVAGAVVGGGLTVIANAPNPAGFGILNSAFGRDGISPLKLFLSALIPTFIALLVFWLP